MARSWNPVFRGFTFAETLVVIALLVLSAGLATQLLFTSLVFNQSHEAAQKRYRSLLALKTELLSDASRVMPPSWANPETSFVQSESGLTVKYWDGTAESASLTADADGYLRWKDPSGSAVWGPWPGCKVEFWKVSDRIAGLQVTLSESGIVRTLKFPWGAWPL